MEGPLEIVQNFWDTEACGTHFVSEEAGTPRFYERYRNFRYQTEWHIREWVPFAEARGKKVLEIGCGNGADGVLFAQAGADYTGVDLTPAAVEATEKHFQCLGLPGTFQTENAESLSFPDASFDWVYAYGVLHHTAHPEKAFAEVYRVLRPGGRAYLMLYHQNSFNYYVRIMGYMRLRLLVKVFSRLGRWSRDRQSGSDGLQGVRGNQIKAIWDIHYRHFLREGWGYLKPEKFVHHCTDGPECPHAFVFTKKELFELFASFQSIRCFVYHFPLRKYAFGKWMPKFVEAFLARQIGWYLCVSLVK